MNRMVSLCYPMNFHWLGQNKLLQPLRGYHAADSFAFCKGKGTVQSIHCRWYSALRVQAQKTVLLVESPAKAKKIQQFLGPSYQVLASYGHVRDLPARLGSVDPDNGFSMTWEIPPRARKTLNDITESLSSNISSLILATDPDREGEAISWHLQEELQRRRKLSTIKVSRVTFTEVTKPAVQQALQNPRQVSIPLVDAYKARRALDYLVGFYISPVLWKKLPGTKSAGRVQSPALRLLSDRQIEIERFDPQEYYTVSVGLQTYQGTNFAAQLVEADGRNLSKEPLSEKAHADDAVRRLEGATLKVKDVKERQVRLQPQAPFITSSLQQAASSMLGFSSEQTMSIAQKLYEGTDNPDPDGGGFITYMRTDGLTIGEDALNDIRSLIGKKFGKQFVCPVTRLFKSKTKNAQEAHEAIRPTDPGLTPNQLPQSMPHQHKNLYELIWRRTIASQMSEALTKQVGASFSTASGDLVVRAGSSEVVFPGYQSVYGSKFFRNAQEDMAAHKSEQNTLLSSLQEGEEVDVIMVEPEQHFTSAPARYSEASLIKRLEELGIGRPSTYATIMRTLQARGYMDKQGRSLAVQSRGRVLSAYLMSYFPRYVDFDFTSSVEEELDRISAGEADWHEVISRFWGPFQQHVETASAVPPRDIIDTLDQTLGAHFFSYQKGSTEEEARRCPACSNRLILKTSPIGAFIGCTAHPDCKYTRPMACLKAAESPLTQQLRDGGILLGHEDQTGAEIRLKEGQYGPYIQCSSPDNKKPISKSFPADEFEALLNGQIDVASAERLASTLLTPPKALGHSKHTGEEIVLASGPYGMYLKCGSVNARIPKGQDPEQLTAEQAVAIVANREEFLVKHPGKDKRGRNEAKAPSKKASASKAGTKKKDASRPTAGHTASRLSPSSPGKKSARPLSGYNIFCKEMRQSYKARGVDQSPTETMKMLGRDWSSLTPEEKEGWAERAQSHNEKAGSNGEPSAPVSSKHASTTASKSDSPKKVSGYIKFSQHRRAELKGEEHGNLRPQEIVSLLAKEWREYSLDEKDSWNQKAKA